MTALPSEGVESLPLDDLQSDAVRALSSRSAKSSGTLRSTSSATAAHPDRFVRRTTRTAEPAGTAWINWPQPQTANALIHSTT